MTSVARRRDHEDSGEYSDASQDNEHNNSGNDGQQESDYDSAGSESEHSDQDPENKEAERRVDDDEDRSNPQYIPKRGTFYEHDDRTAASGEETTNTTSETASEKKEGSEPATERRRPPRKSDIVNKWSHDKYNENEQIPKSRDELVAIYGYDIRNEDAPPHARRNRRYGRGPNKYTRTWEDEEAYRRQSAAPPTPRKPPGPEDFPELDAQRRYDKPRTPRPRSKSQPAVNEPVENGGQLRRNASIKTAKKPAVKPGTGRTAVKAKPKEKMPALENLTITANVNNNNNQGQGRKVTSVAQQRPVPTDQAKKKPNNAPQPQQQANPPPNKSPPQQPPVQQQQQKPQQQQLNQNQQQQPASGGGSKRYSSLRQRPLADSYTPQQQAQQQPQQQQQQPAQQQQQHRYHGAGPGEFVPPASGLPHPQHLIHQQVRVNATAGAHAASPPLAPAPQVRLNMMEQQQMVHTHHNLHNMPQGHSMGVANQLQPSQAYAPPAMMPAQYMQQTGVGGAYSGPLFAGAPHGPPAHVPATFAAHPQMYTPHHNYVAQATHAGGVTYYNCAEQEPPAPPRAQRRPTAAIPIVSPHHAERPANSSEKDNIDRIVENMFVRKPWPATHGSDSKEKSTEPRSSQEPPSKESSQPNSLTSSSISTDSKPSEVREEKLEPTKNETEDVPSALPSAVPVPESIPTDA